MNWLPRGLRVLPTRRHGLSAVVLCAALGVLAGCGGSGSTEAEDDEGAATSGGEALPDAPRVTGAEARAMVANGAVLLDVTPHARADRSLIEGRTHIPLSELDARLGELPRDRDIVVYCLGGGASPRAGARLRAAGYRAFVMGAKTNWDL
jgi:rhodanese-related sulfurtransferase